MHYPERLSQILASLLMLCSVCAAEGKPLTALSLEQEQLAQQIIGEVMSPFCPGRILHDCPSGSATELRERIREKIKGGESAAAIFDFLYATYGDGIRASPRQRGFGLVAWLAPLVFLLTGLLLIILWLRVRGTSIESESHMAALEPLDVDLEARIRREVERTE